MTREEAIAIIENEKECVNRASKNDYCNRDCYNCELVKTSTEILTALDMAIKALEQESCEDCISRKEDISELEYQLGTATDYKEALKEVLRKTKNTRSVRPKEKMGHWILTDVEGFKVWHCNCSKCNKDPLDFVGGSENWWLIKTKLPKYCPNCGAKMVEPQESEDKE